jgi:CBS domain-containing protein
MLVRELMSPDPVHCTPDTPLKKVPELMAKNDCGAVPVCDRGRIVGMITDRDLVTRGLAMSSDPELLPASAIMTHNLFTVAADDRIEHAITIMESEQVRRLPVFDEEQLVGIISMTDLAEHLPERMAGELLREVSDRPRKPRSAL